jgi:hypothetical protein
MKKQILVISLVYLFSMGTGMANPFQCKIPGKTVIKKKQPVQAIELKGFALINKQHIAIISIGENSFEVIAGDTIDEVTIINVNSTGIHYSIDNKLFHIPLDIP